MQIETYEQAVAYWNSRINYEKIGMPQDMGLLKLDRMHLLLYLLGKPHEWFEIVHITGTKGKGSTATMIASVLQAAGYRVGLYTSPHLVYVEERIQINGVPIDRQEMTKCMNLVAQACQQVEAQGEAQPTFFEIITAIGMLHFQREKVNLAVLEVGMGGRFDATNVVTPLVSVITSISLDHVDHLGHTVEAIAFEKAGIIKEGRPVVSGVRDQGPADVIKERAASLHAPHRQLGVHFDRHWKPGDMQLGTLPQVQWTSTAGDSPWYELNLWGKHQANNAAIALDTLKILEKEGVKIESDAYHRGLKHAVIPGRLEVLGRSPWLIVDAAHNVDSIQMLLDWLNRQPSRQRIILFAVSKDKLIREMLAQLVGNCDSIVFTRYSSSSRGADPQQLYALWKDLGGTGGEVIEHATKAWDYLVQQARQADLLCATGSVFLVGEIRDHVRRVM